MLRLNGDAGPLVDTIMWWASSVAFWIPLYAFITWLVWRRFSWRGTIGFIVVAALMVLCADQTATLFKTFMPKLRPTHNPELTGILHTVNGYVGGLYGTVSSHAANTLGFAILTGLVMKQRWIWVMLLPWVALVSYSRIYLGVHYPFDVMFGLLDGLLWGLVWYGVWILLKKRLEFEQFYRQ